jgi:hypothetical protein
MPQLALLLNHSRILHGCSSPSCTLDSRWQPAYRQPCILRKLAAAASPRTGSSRGSCLTIRVRFSFEGGPRWSASGRGPGSRRRGRGVFHGTAVTSRMAPFKAEGNWRGLSPERAPWPTSLRCSVSRSTATPRVLHSSCNWSATTSAASPFTASPMRRQARRCSPAHSFTRRTCA